MSALLFTLLAPLALYALWIFYLSVMNLKRAQENGLLSKTAMILGSPVLLIGFTLDIIVNLCVLTPALLELPQELTVTSRLKRHIAEGSGWRYRVATWFIPLLDPFDPSGHHITVGPGRV